MKLATWLQVNRVSQKQLALELGIDYTTVSKYCSGNRKPSLDMAIKIEDATDLEVEVREWGIEVDD